MDWVVIDIDVIIDFFYPNYSYYIDKSTGKYEVDSLMHKGHYDGHVEHLLK